MTITATTIRGATSAKLLGALIAVTAVLLFAGPASALAAPELQVDSSHHPSTVPAGAFATYELTLKNKGDASTTDSPTVSFSLPSTHLAVAEVSVPSLFGFLKTWNCSTPDSQTVNCTLAGGVGLEPAPGQEACKAFSVSCPITISVKVDRAAPVGTVAAAITASGGSWVPFSGTDPIDVGPPGTFGIRSFDGEALQQNGDPATQAGSHPYTASTTFFLNTIPVGGGHSFPAETLRSAVAELPAGLLGSLTALPTCTEEELAAAENGCPDKTQIGIFELWRGGIFGTDGHPAPFRIPLYLIKPPLGTLAEFGFNFQGTTIHFEARLRTGGDYGLDVESLNAPELLTVEGATVEIWGTPASSSFDPIRGQCGTSTPGPNCPRPAGIPAKPFLTLPTSCEGPQETRLHALGWEGGEAEASFLSHDNALPVPNPIGNTGCAALDFSPTLKARPTASSADSPTGFEVDVHLPQRQHEDPEGTVEANQKAATLTFPEGLTVNPSGANGLGACSSSQIDLHGPGAAHCPDAAKIGTVEVETPAIDHPLPGSLFVATPHDNPFDSLLAVYLVVEDPVTGVIVKLAGRVDPDPTTGRLTTSFEGIPQAPVEDVRVKLFGGPSAALRTPAVCGPYATASSLTPWSAPESGPPATPSDEYSIDQGPGGGTCATTDAARPNAPAFETGSVSPVAGAYSPFVIHLRREDGSQEFSSITVKPPAGLLGKLAGVPECSDAALASAAGKSGREEDASPSCPAASQVGSVEVGAGAGPSPYYTGGKAYLAGPYKGAPLSLAIVTPAVAGPFDLGTVVVRTALHVDSKTAQITAVSDPIPHILQGIVLDVRSIDVKLDRPDFILNPTSCNPSQVTGQVLAVNGLAATVANRFQVGECERLGFKPNVTLRLHGGTRRGAYQRLTATVTPRPGDANIARAAVTLPHSEFLAQEHIRTVCTRVQFAAKACPPGSIYGHAEATTPLLDQPLVGPVYLRSSDNPLPDLVAALRGPDNQPIEVELSGRTDSKHGGIRNTFDLVPDAPVSKFTLQLFGGQKSLIVNSRNLCKGKKQRATVLMNAQNGMLRRFRPAVGNDCGKRRKRARHRRDGR